MRLLPLLLLLALAACAAGVSAGPGEQSADLPLTGNDAQRDGFYDGGIYDPDLTRRNLSVEQ